MNFFSRNEFYDKVRKKYETVTQKWEKNWSTEILCQAILKNQDAMNEYVLRIIGDHYSTKNENFSTILLSYSRQE